MLPYIYCALLFVDTMAVAVLVQGFTEPSLYFLLWLVHAPFATRVLLLRASLYADGMNSTFCRQPRHLPETFDADSMVCGVIHALF